MTTKVFVGNLAFPTTDQALAEAFQDCGKVKSGVVITRGRRSLGYGFVEFESPDAALHAVNTKNNTDLKGRTIKVELASDNPVRPERPSTSNPGPSASAPAGGASGGNVNPRNVGNATSSSEPTSGVAPRRQPRRMNRRRRPVNNNNNSRPQANPEASNNKPASGGTESGGKRRRRRTNKNQNNEDRVLSTTAVFVANLPFTVKDEDLKAYFKEFNPQSAHVVVTRNGRSRGYGFVDFNSEKDQQNSITAKNKQKFDDREITVTPS
jgi:RNA recognition motif-containing protein